MSHITYYEYPYFPNGIINIKSIYLTKGTGNAWAGHIKVRFVPLLPLKAFEFSTVGNLGATLPTGSK